jgi:hypothetical protein
MSKAVRKVNFAKWSFILGTPIALIGAMATLVTVPEIGCKVGLALAACVVPMQDINLITQSETGEPLAGVKIQFIAKGAPEIQFTDNNGYAKVKLPSNGDVRVSLIKEGYPAQDFTLNVQNEQDTVRIIRFTSSGTPDVQQVASAFTAQSPTPTATPPTSGNSSPTLLKQIEALLGLWG